MFLQILPSFCYSVCTSTTLGQDLEEEQVPLSRATEEGVFAVGFAAGLSHWTQCSCGGAGCCLAKAGRGDHTWP